MTAGLLAVRTGRQLSVAFDLPAPTLQAGGETGFCLLAGGCCVASASVARVTGFRLSVHDDRDGIAG